MNNIYYVDFIMHGATIKVKKYYNTPEHNIKLCNSNEQSPS